MRPAASRGREGVGSEYCTNSKSGSGQSDGFTLQFTADLADWFPLPPPLVSEGSYVVTNSISGPARFYRLVK